VASIHAHWQQGIFCYSMPPARRTHRTQALVECRIGEDSNYALWGKALGKQMFGQCALCLKQRQLEKSHYLGRGLHLLSQEYGEAVMMTPERIQLTAKQLWAHLLCAACEDILGANESYAHEWINRKDRFRLLERMNLVVSVGRTLHGLEFSGTDIGVSTDRLAHFALGVFWRASAHNWKTLGLQTTSIYLGALAERISLYLLGEGPFPDGIVLLMTVCTDHGSQGLVFAPSLMKGGIYPAFSMMVRGIKFTLVTGNNLPEEIREACCVRSTRKAIFVRDCAAGSQHAFGHIRQTAAVDARLQ
jgi:hypothetical protein